MLTNSSISSKGRCVENFGSHYVMEEEERGEKCWRCMTIFRKHQNVLQYKESYCETYFDTFSSLCDNIAGDSPMFSMFRNRQAEAVRCPFKGPFTFSYSKGGSGLNLCSYPASYLDSCTDQTRLQLSFQACTDVRGSESVEEQLQCLAHWREGSKHYMVAQRRGQHVYSDEARYRCFVYEKEGKGDNRTVRMAQSLSATCRGLWSPQEGYRTFALEKVAKTGAASSCPLPSFLTAHHSWTSLDSSVRLHLNSGDHSMRLSNLQDSLHPEDSRVSCHASLEGEHGGRAKLVTFVKSGCDSGFVCMVLEEQAEGVVVVELGQQARSPQEACSQLYFSRSVIKSLLLVTSHSPARQNSCPMSGRYLLSHPPSLPSLHPAPPCPHTGPSSLHLVAGCGSPSLRVEHHCSATSSPATLPPTSSNYSCHQHWSTGDGLTHVLLSSSASHPHLCLSYTGGGEAWLSSTSCLSSSPHTFSLSNPAPCIQTLLSSSLSSPAQQTASPLPSLLLTLLFALIAPPSLC